MQKFYHSIIVNRKDIKGFNRAKENKQECCQGHGSIMGLLSCSNSFTCRGCLLGDISSKIKEITLGYINSYPELQRRDKSKEKGGQLSISHRVVS